MVLPINTQDDSAFRRARQDGGQRAEAHTERTALV